MLPDLLQKRVELLQETLFVRCAAATLLGAYRGVLEIDAGFGVGCKVDEGAQALRLCLGETKYSAGGGYNTQQVLIDWLCTHACLCCTNIETTMGSHTALLLDHVNQDTWLYRARCM
jgi:hypothetical protein